VDDRLEGAAVAVGAVSSHFYLAPADGFSIGQDLLARADGDHAVAAAITYRSGPIRPQGLRAGQVVVLVLPRSATSGRAIVDAFLADARRARLRAVTLGRLVADRSA